MSVSDAREDPRVRGNPVIEDLGVIAYLAVPLALPDGCVIGALCGIDHRPRAWTAAEEGALQDLAGAVEAEMAAGLRLREAGPAGAVLRESEARYRALFEAIDTGFCIIEMKFDGEQRPIDYRFVEVNPAFAGQTGLADAVGKWMRELAPDHEQHWFDIYGRIALTGEAVRFENVAAALGRWYDVYAFRIGEPGAHRVAILFNDISDRRRAETALRESEARYRALFDVSPQVVWFADAEGRCTYVNRHYTDFAGLPAERVLGDGWLAALHPEDRAGARAAWADAVASEGDYEVEYRIRRGADGSHRWFLVRGAPLRGPDGRIERWIGVGVDIDDRRRAEEALRASEERFRRAMGIGTVGVHFFGLDGRVTDANRAFERMSGYTRGELLALGDRKVLTPPEFSDATGRAAAELAASGETAPYEKQMVRKDGSRWWGLFAPTRLAGYGRGAQCVEFVVDVTERKRAEGALRASEGRLRDLLATLDLGASMARDLDGTIRFWSEGCARLYGWSAAEAVGQDAHALLRTAFPVPRAEIGAALERDGEWTGDLRQWTRDGAEVVVAARKMLRRHPDGRPVAVLESLTDVTRNAGRGGAARERGAAARAPGRTAARLAPQRGRRDGRGAGARAEPAADRGRERRPGGAADAGLRLARGPRWAAAGGAGGHGPRGGAGAAGRADRPPPARLRGPRRGRPAAGGPAQAGGGGGRAGPGGRGGARRRRRAPRRTRPASGARRPDPDPAGAVQPDAQRARGDGRRRGAGEQRRGRAAAPRAGGVRGTRRPRGGRGRGGRHRPWPGAGGGRTAVRALRLDQAGRHGRGPVDLPLDRGGAWRAALGRAQPGRRHGVPLHPAGGAVAGSRSSTGDEAAR